MFFLVYMHAVLFLLNFYFPATGRVGKEHDTATVTEDEEATQQNMQNPERCEFDKGNYYQHKTLYLKISQLLPIIFSEFVLLS